MSSMAAWGYMSLFSLWMVGLEGFAISTCTPSTTILDMGCRATLTKSFPFSVADDNDIIMMGIHQERHVVEHLRMSHTNIPFFQSDFEKTPFGDATMDMILISDLSCIQCPHRLVQEIIRLLRPEGVVILQYVNPVDIQILHETLQHVSFEEIIDIMDTSSLSNRLYHRPAPKMLMKHPSQHHPRPPFTAVKTVRSLSLWHSSSQRRQHFRAICMS